MNSTNTICHFCGKPEETGMDYWASITIESNSYSFEDGMHPQERTWILCRSCKKKFFMMMAKNEHKPKEPTDKQKEAIEWLNKQTTESIRKELKKG